MIYLAYKRVGISSGCKKFKTNRHLLFHKWKQFFLKLILFDKNIGKYGNYFYENSSDSRKSL